MLISILSILLALVAFAANSLLGRMALDDPLIDPFSFTTLRLVSGSLVLLLLTWRQGILSWRSGSWISGVALLTYAFAFSLAYVSLGAGVGALILFGMVQITMMGAAIWDGEPLSFRNGVGLCLAMGGLIYLVFPGLTAPPAIGAFLMGLSGIAWGVYTLRGRGSQDPLLMTTGNFARAAPLAVGITLATLMSIQWEPRGLILALISGGITSGLGYVLWYRVLRLLTTVQASILQLLVPVLASLGGVFFLSEQVSWRVILSSGLILGGIALGILRPKVPETIQLGHSEMTSNEQDHQ